MKLHALSEKVKYGWKRDREKGGDGAIRISACPTEVWDLTPHGDTHKRNVSTRVIGFLDKKDLITEDVQRETLPSPSSCSDSIHTPELPVSWIPYLTGEKSSMNPCQRGSLIF